MGGGGLRTEKCEVRSTMYGQGVSIIEVWGVPSEMKDDGLQITDDGEGQFFD